MTTEKKIVLLTAALLITGVGYAGYRYFKRQASLLEDYEITPVGIKILKWEKDGSVATLEFTIRITNKAAIEAQITKLYSDVYLNNQYVGFLENNGTILVPGKGTADAKVQITFAPKQVLKDLVGTLAILIGSKDVPYRLKGYVKVKSSFIGISVPFDQTRSIKKDLLGSLPVMS